MKNKTAKINFILLTVIAVLVLVFCVVSFNIPGTTKTFNGFARAFNLGLDFGDGTSAIYTVDSDSFYAGSDVSYDASKIVQKLIDSKYGDGSAEIVDGHKIKITVPGTAISSEILVSSLEMKIESGEEAQTYVTGADIKKVEYRMNGTTHGVYITFNKEGKTNFATLTREAANNGGTVYIYLNRDYENGQSISISEEITTGYCFLSSSSKTSAQTYAKVLNNTTYGLNLTLEGETTTVHSNFATWQKIVIAVVTGLVVIASFVYLILKFKHLGWIASLVMLIFAEACIITFSLVPQIRLTFVSYLAMLFGYLLTFAMLLTVLYASKREYESGKKLPASLKSGYSKSVMTVVDTTVVAMILCIVSFIFGTATLNSFAGPIAIMLLGAAVCILGLYRWFVHMYLAINPGKGTYVNFVRKEGVNEIK